MPAQPPTALSIPTFALTQLHLLSAELLSETASTSHVLSTSSPRTLSLSGLALLNLTVGSSRTGLGGKTVWELVRDAAVGGREEGLGEHGVRVGDVVGVREMGGGKKGKKEGGGMGGGKGEEKEVRGVVVKVAREAVAVALDKEEEGEAMAGGGRVWMCVFLSLLLAFGGSR